MVLKTLVKFGFVAGCARGIWKERFTLFILKILFQHFSNGGHVDVILAGVFND